jgi:hypothetical protein
MLEATELTRLEAGHQTGPLGRTQGHRDCIRWAETVLDLERQVVLLTRTKHLPSADTW